jgi:hypothetical protein
MNVGDTHYPPLEELRAAHGQEHRYGIPRIPQIDGSVTCNESDIPFASDSGLQQQPLQPPDVFFRPIPGVPDTYLGMSENVLCLGLAW